MSILVTGAGGFIGQHVVRALCMEDHDVVAVYRNMHEPLEHLGWRSIEMDLRDRQPWAPFRDMNVTTVVHCAAVLPDRLEGAEAKLAAEINTRIDRQVLRFCEQRNCRLVYLSGTGVYGGKEALCHENSAVEPLGEYLKAKVISEQQMTESLSEQLIILRVCAPYGPGQMHSTVLRVFIDNALANLDLKYYGTGSREQDFLAVEDVARAIQYAIAHTTVHGIFNIASGIPITMKELASVVVHTIRQTHSKIASANLPDPQENYRARIDINKARNILGWTPSISLQEGIQRWAAQLVPVAEITNTF